MSRVFSLKLILLFSITIVLIQLFSPRPSTTLLKDKQQITECIVINTLAGKTQTVVLNADESQLLLSRLKDVLVQYRGPYNLIKFNNSNSIYCIMFFNRFKEECGRLTVGTNNYIYTDKSQYIIWGRGWDAAVLLPYFSPAEGEGEDKWTVHPS